MDDFKKTQRIASYLIIGTVLWEFFSYYGMQALLILYLTQKLNFNDAKAYTIYGSFTSLIYVTPIIGGWLADRFCGYRYAALWGSVLIIMGHLTLGFSTQGLYAGLTFLILGIGLFKSNTICLIGECFSGDTAGRSSAFTWYYISGNLGAITAQILCPYLAQRLGWHYGFIAAALGMLLGFILLISTHRYFKWYWQKLPDTRWIKYSPASQLSIASIFVLASFSLTITILKYSLVGYVLIFTSVAAFYTGLAIYKQATPPARKKLIRVFILLVFALGFWIFDQQGSGSISLFISRFVNRQFGSATIPAGMFQAINPTIILVFGVVMAWLWKYLARHQVQPQPVSKMSAGLLLLTLGFILIAWAAKIANYQPAPMIFPIIGLMCIGASEIFIDPVMLATITDIAPPRTEGRMIAMYYLATGAIANFLAAKIANFTIDPTTNTATALTYHQAYLQITWVSLSMFLILIIWGLKGFKLKQAFC